MTRLLVGNLDGEVAMAREDAALRLRHHTGRGPRPNPRDPRYELRPRLSARLSALAAVMTVLAREGDGLWARVSIDTDRFGPILPRPRLFSGSVPHATAVLPWAAASVSPLADPQAGADLAGRLWSAGGPSRPHRTATVSAGSFHHRSFLRLLRRRRGWRTPGEATIRSLDQLLLAIARLEEEAGRWTPWILKVPFTASGRGRLRGAGVPDSAQISRIRGLLGLHGRLFFERWLDRRDDFGTAGLVASEVEVVGLHRLIVSGEGRFLGVEAGAIPAAVSSVLAEETAAVGRVLQTCGYRGPFGLDAFTYTGSDGAPALQPLCELNARLTFGWMLHLFRERLGEGISGLHVGRVATLANTQAAAVLWPSADDDTAVWLTGSGLR